MISIVIIFLKIVNPFGKFTILSRSPSSWKKAERRYTKRQTSLSSLQLFIYIFHLGSLKRITPEYIIQSYVTLNYIKTHQAYKFYCKNTRIISRNYNKFLDQYIYVIAMYFLNIHLNKLQKVQVVYNPIYIHIIHIIYHSYSIYFF